MSAYKSRLEGVGTLGAPDADGVKSTHSVPMVIDKYPVEENYSISRSPLTMSHRRC